MSDPSIFEVRRPKPRPFRDLGKERLTSLLAVGVVNPMGPTLNALAVEGELTSGRALPILHIMLNPFAQEVAKVGVARLSDPGTIAAGLERFFSLEFGSCPSLLLRSSLLPEDEAARMYATFLRTVDGGRAMIERVRRFPGDPWSRITDEMSANFPADTRDQTLTEAEALELATTQLTEANLASELAAFLYAWKGSIKFQADLGTSMADTALQFEPFLKLFGYVAASCVVPEATTSR